MATSTGTFCKDGRRRPLLGEVTVAAGNIGREIGELCQRNEGIAEEALPLIKVVIPQSISVQAHQVHEFDGLRCPDRVARRHGYGMQAIRVRLVAPSFGAVDIEPWLEESGTTNGKSRIDGSETAEGVGGLGEWNELAVIITNIKNGHLAQLACVVYDFIPNLSAGIVRPGDTQQ
jgi:hypothetical protein